MGEWSFYVNSYGWSAASFLSWFMVRYWRCRVYTSEVYTPRVRWCGSFNVFWIINYMFGITCVICFYIKGMTWLEGKKKWIPFHPFITFEYCIQCKKGNSFLLALFTPALSVPFENECRIRCTTNTSAAWWTSLTCNGVCLSDWKKYWYMLHHSSLLFFSLRIRPSEIWPNSIQPIIWILKISTWYNAKSCPSQFKM